MSELDSSPTSDFSLEDHILDVLTRAGGTPSGVPGTPSGVPGTPSGVPGTPSGVPGTPSGVPGTPSGVPGTPGSGHGTLSAPEIAQAINPDSDWHGLLLPIRRAAVALAQRGRLVIYRKGKPVDPNDFRGVYRLGLPRQD
jgi:hypothetical protein